MERITITFVLLVFAASTPLHSQEATPATGGTPVLTSSPRRLTKIVNSYPAAASDGSRVLYQSNRTGVFQIYSMKVDGTDVRQLTNLPDNSYGPSYSPDGKLIAFAHGSGGKSDVYVMRADGSDAHAVTDDGLDNSHPHWSPDGRRILFNSSRTTPVAIAAMSTKSRTIFSAWPPTVPNCASTPIAERFAPMHSFLPT
jgi:Tol biopolymer transport system component